ncbi:hypothetical protein HZS_42, partial [Henneguya salminicola]
CSQIKIDSIIHPFSCSTCAQKQKSGLECKIIVIPQLIHMCQENMLFGYYGTEFDPTQTILGDAIGVPRSQLSKFVQTFWSLFFYIILFSVDIYLVYKYQLFNTEKQNLFDIHPKWARLGLDLYISRIVQASFNVQELYSTFFDYKFRADFFISVIHQICFIIFQILSFPLGFINAGVIIEFLHDFNNDIYKNLVIL